MNGEVDLEEPTDAADSLSPRRGGGGKAQEATGNDIGAEGDDGTDEDDDDEEEDDDDDEGTGFEVLRTVVELEEAIESPMFRTRPAEN